jgi:hypothetical protein
MQELKKASLNSNTCVTPICSLYYLFNAKTHQDLARWYDWPLSYVIRFNRGSPSAAASSLPSRRKSAKSGFMIKTYLSIFIRDFPFKSAQLRR